MEETESSRSPESLGKMPYGSQPVCSHCQTTTTALWRKTDKGEVICSGCFSSKEKVKTEQETTQGASTPQPCSSGSTQSGSTVINNGNNVNSNHSSNNGDNGQQPQSAIVNRRSARTKLNKQSQTKTNSTKGKGRRIIFKKSATKAPTAVATPVTSSYVFYKGSYYQAGDIVSMIDVDGDVYYAQIRGLLQDQYCEKSATVTWLLPTQSSPKDRFDPATYIIGPDEEIPRKLDCMEFVCHAPSDYFKASDSPYPTLSQKPELCYVWSRLRPQIKPIKKTAEDIF